MEKALTESIERFFAKYTKQEFRAGQGLISGNQPQGVYYLVDGYVRQFSTDPQGNDILVNIYKPGSFFPMMWAVAKIPNRFYFETLTPCTVYRAPLEEVVEFIQDKPPILLDIINKLYSGMEVLLYRLEHALGGSAYHKVILTLILLSRRFGEPTGADKQTRISLKMSQQNMASMAGTSKETFTRVLSQLKAKKLVDLVNQEILIHNPDLLIREIDPA